MDKNAPNYYWNLDLDSVKMGKDKSFDKYGDVMNITSKKMIFDTGR